MRDLAIKALETILDPDVGVNIVDLGLVETLDISDAGLQLTLIMTSPACPQSGYLADQARHALRHAFPDRPVSVETAPSPLWEAARMSPAARRQLGWS